MPDRSAADGPPPRPPVSRGLAPPGPTAGPTAPPAVRAAAWAWLGSFVAATVGIAATVLGYDELRARLTATARADDPGIVADVLERGVRLTVTVVLAGSGLLVLLAALCLALLLRRRPGAWWALLLVGVLTLAAVLVGQSLVTGGPGGARVAFLLQGALVLAGLGAQLVPATRGWLRRD